VTHVVDLCLRTSVLPLPLDRAFGIAGIGSLGGNDQAALHLPPMLPTPRVVFPAPRTYLQILTTVKRRWNLLSPALEACPSWMISAGGQRERMTGKCQPSLRWQRPSRSRGQPAMGWHLTMARLRRPSSGRGGKEEEGTRGDGGSWRQQCPVQQDRYKVARSMARFAAQTQRRPHHPAEGGVQGYGSAPPPHGQMGLSPANCRKVMTACVHIRKKKNCVLSVRTH